MIRPVYTYCKTWTRLDVLVERDKDNIRVATRCYHLSGLIDLMPLVGVPCYLDLSCKRVFDLSASHLCPNQLEKIKCNYF